MVYDAIIIGAGQAGPSIAALLAGQGKKVAIAEGGKPGGTCLNYGCRPTKALRASARAAFMARRAAEYGVNVGAVTVDFAAVMARKNDIIGGMQEGFVGWLENLENATLYRDFAHFLGKNGDLYQVQAGDTLLEAPQVFINVGARPRQPDLPGLDAVPYLTNREMLALEKLPDHLIIVGGSYIGLEFGQMFRRFGSEVTIVEMSPHIASREDADVAAAISQFLEDEAITLETHHRAVRVERSADGSTIILTIANKETNIEKTISGSHLLMAAGRVPNSDTLNLEAVGVAVDERGYVVTNERLETNQPGIWALGDVNGRGAFTHTSYQEYEIVAANLTDGDRSVAGRHMAYAMFTDPPLGRVGMSEEQARKSGRNVLVARYPMDKVSRAQLDSETTGLIKVLVDADSEEILGAAALGMHGDDVIQVFSNFMATGASYKVMQNALPVHPTVAEFIPTILGTLEPLT